MSLQPFEDHAGLYFDNEKLEIVSTREFIRDTIVLSLVNGKASYKLLPGESILIGSIQCPIETTQLELSVDTLMISQALAVQGLVDYKKTEPCLVSFNKPANEYAPIIKTHNCNSGDITIDCVRRLGLGATLPEGYKTE